MNENTTKVVEYTLVILIGFIISYVIFVQAQESKNAFKEMGERVEAVETAVEIVRTDIIINNSKIKQLEGKVNPPVVAPEAMNPETGKSIDGNADTIKTAPDVAPKK